MKARRCRHHHTAFLLPSTIQKIYYFILISMALTLLFPLSAFAEGTVLLPQTGQFKCYDLASGLETRCAGTGQDGEFRQGVDWPEPRIALPFIDRLTGLMWFASGISSANWQDALDAIAVLNANNAGGYSDWRLPNRLEMESIFDYNQPAFPPGIMTNSDWGILPYEFWSSTTCADDQTKAWVLVSSSGMWQAQSKTSSAYYWPVRSATTCDENSSIVCLPRTGQNASYAEGDDGALQMGVAWPNPRFIDNGDGTITDTLTGLMWTKEALPGTVTSLQEALDLVRAVDTGGHTDWRLPNIKELQSLIDFGRNNPALLQGHPFTGTGIYVASTLKKGEYAREFTGWLECFGVSLADGSFLDLRTNIFYYSGIGVRPVRGGGSFVKHIFVKTGLGSGTLIDSAGGIDCGVDCNLLTKDDAWRQGAFTLKFIPDEHTFPYPNYDRRHPWAYLENVCYLDAPDACCRSNSDEGVFQCHLPAVDPRYYPGGRIMHYSSVIAVELQLNTTLSVPDTGQITFFNNTAPIACPAQGEPFYGQDATYCIEVSSDPGGHPICTPYGTHSYTTMNVENSVLYSGPAGTMARDNVTHLLWKTGTSPAELNEQYFGNHADWRLPTVQELAFLVDRNRSSPAIDTRYFPEISPDMAFLTATTGVVVSFEKGEVKRADTGYDIAVCGPDQDQSELGFRDNGNGTVTDRRTQITWQQQGPGTMQNWEKALEYCENLTLGGHADWRLPDANELLSLVDYDRYDPAIDTRYFPDTSSSNYFTSTTDVSKTANVWVVNFKDGLMPSAPKYYSLKESSGDGCNVRCMSYRASNTSTTTTTVQQKTTTSTTTTSVAAGVGTVQVVTNLARATFIILTPSLRTINGSGIAWTSLLAPTGDYTVTFKPVAGYTTPDPQTKTLLARETITFRGTYVAAPATTTTSAPATTTTVKQTTTTTAKATTTTTAKHATTTTAKASTTTTTAQSSTSTSSAAVTSSTTTSTAASTTTTVKSSTTTSAKPTTTTTAKTTTTTAQSSTSTSSAAVTSSTTTSTPPSTTTTTAQSSTSTTSAAVTSSTTTSTSASTTTTTTSEQRFVDNGNGTVTDTKTGLVWLKNANPCGYKNWNDAVTYCNNLASGTAGLTDGSTAGQWHLPTKAEIEGLGTDPVAWWEEGSPVVPWTTPGEPFTNVQSFPYWSSTVADNPDNAWGISMGNGYVDDYNKSTNLYNVWPVRP